MRNIEQEIHPSAQLVDRQDPDRLLHAGRRDASRTGTVDHGRRLARVAPDGVARARFRDLQESPGSSVDGTADPQPSEPRDHGVLQTLELTSFAAVVAGALWVGGILLLR